MAGDSASAASVVFSTLSSIFWACLFVPQIIQNYQRSNTDGLSMSMCLLWSLANVCVICYLVFDGQSFVLSIPWLCVTVGAIVTIWQIFGYNTLKNRNYSEGKIWFYATLVASLITIFFALLGVAIYELFAATQSNVVIILFGTVGPSVILALGFVPQIKEIYVTKSGEGYSTRMSFLDSAGCVCGSIALILDDGPLQGLVPFIVIFLLQWFTLALKYYYASLTRPTGSLDKSDQIEATTTATPSEIECCLEPKAAVSDPMAEETVDYHSIYPTVDVRLNAENV